MIQYEEKIPICKQAHFVFTKEDSFALYLEFGFDEYHATGFYITSYAEMEEIRKLLNKNQTGFARNSLGYDDLQKLIGKSARIQCAGIGSKCIYNGFIIEGELIQK